MSHSHAWVRVKLRIREDDGEVLPARALSFLFTANPDLLVTMGREGQTTLRFREAVASCHAVDPPIGIPAETWHIENRTSELAAEISTRPTWRAAYEAFFHDRIRVADIPALVALPSPVAEKN